ncbi:MAG: DUF7379 domain-containing protein, partial [Geminicoccaceae bacterium]
MTTISAPGTKVEDFSKDDVDLGLLEKAKPKITPIGQLRLDASRAGGEPAKLEDVDPTAVVEVTFEGDLQWITTVERLKRDFPNLQDRSADPAKDEFHLPTHLGTTALRGGLDGVKISNASFFDLDINSLLKELDLAGKAGEIAGELIGPKLAKWFDNKLIEDPGLYRLEAAGDEIDLSKQETELPLPPDDLPYLLFLHGTGSTTRGSFAGLWTENAGVWNQIIDLYDSRMLALEHHTLAESPIANALSVITHLPKKARLHIVSHSRGGMIGELLGRAGRLS